MKVYVCIFGWDWEGCSEDSMEVFFSYEKAEECGKENKDKYDFYYVMEREVK